MSGVSATKLKSTSMKPMNFIKQNVYQNQSVTFIFIILMGFHGIRSIRGGLRVDIHINILSNNRGTLHHYFCIVDFRDNLINVSHCAHFS